MTYQTKMWVIGSKGVISPDNALQTIMNIPAWAISKFQWGSPYTHIAIVKNVMKDPLMVWEAISGGVVLNKWVAPPKGYDLFYIPCTTSELAAAYIFLSQQEGKGYDYMGLLGFLWRSNSWQNDSKWFCSELAAATMERAGFTEGPNFKVVQPHQLPPTLLLATAKGPYSLQEARDENRR